MKLAVAFAALLSLVAPLFAATVVPPGPLLGTQVWTSANSPYLISGDVTVGMSGRIFIQEGVEVLFSSVDASATGEDNTRCEFRLFSGLLVVSGTKTNPVVFRAESNFVASTWYGITAANGRGAFITNAIIQHAVTGFYSSNTNRNVLDNVTVCSNQTGIRFGTSGTTNVPGTLNAVRVFANTLGMILWSDAPILVSNSAFYRNAIFGSVVKNNQLFVNCIFHANPVRGVEVQGSFSERVIFAGCIFSSNNVALYAGGDGSSSLNNVTLSHCAYWGNTKDFTDWRTPPGTNAVLANPLYQDLPGPDGVMGTGDDDFSLSPGSPCIDAGDNSALVGGPALDLNGNFRQLDDPASLDVAGPLNQAPVVDIGACEYQPPLRILSVRYAPETLSLAVPTVPGGQYQLLSTPDFLQWTNVVGGDFVGDGLVQTQTLSTAASPFLFYRVQLAP